MSTSTAQHIQNQTSFAEISENEAVLVTQWGQDLVKVENQIAGNHVSLLLKFNERVLFHGLGSELERVMELVTAMTEMREAEASPALLATLPDTAYARVLRKFLTA